MKRTSSTSIHILNLTLLYRKSRLILLLIITYCAIGCKKNGDIPLDLAGAIGPAGNDGSLIYAGDSEPSANKGQTGDYYLDTSTGNIYGPKANRSWGAAFNMAGADAKPSSTLLSSEENPKPTDGTLGDFYLNKATYVLYGPKKAGGWGVGLELKGKKGMQGVKSFISLPTQSFAGPVFYDLPGVNEEMLNKSYVAVSWRREQLLVNPGFYRLYPLPYSFTFVRSGATYTATLYHFIVKGGQIGITITNTSPFEYTMEPTVDFKYNFRFIIVEGSALQELSNKNPNVNFKDVAQVNKLLNL